MELLTKLFQKEFVTILLKVLATLVILAILNALSYKIGFLNNFILAPVLIYLTFRLTGVQKNNYKTIIYEVKDTFKRTFKTPAKIDNKLFQILLLVMTIFGIFTSVMILATQYLFYIFTITPFQYAINFTILLVLSRLILAFVKVQYESNQAE